MTDDRSGPSTEDTSTELERLAQRILEIDSRHVDRIFALTLCLFLGVILLLTRQYGWSSQIFPLVIGVPTFGLLVLLLATQFSTRIAAIVRTYSRDQVISHGEELEDRLGQEGSTNEDPLYTKRKRILVISVWIFSLLGLILLIGFLPSILLFMAMFFRFEAEQSWTRSIVFTAVVWVLIIVVFDLILETPFYEGLLEVQLPSLD